MGTNLRYSPLEWANDVFDFGGNQAIGLSASPFGDVYYVDYRNGADSNKGTTPSKAFKTLGAAYTACTSNNNDRIYIDGDSLVVESDMITWAKNRIHVIGVDGPGRVGPGHGARIGFAANDSPAAASLAPIAVTGVRNTFSNIKFESQCTTAESLYAHVDAGEYTAYYRCSFIKISDVGETGATEVVAQGDGTSWIECEFGAMTYTATAARHVMLIDNKVGSNDFMDNNFVDCNFLSATTDADRHFIHCVGTGDTQRYSMFRGCSFINWDIHGSLTTMTDAVHVPANTAAYMVFDANTIVVGCTNFAQSTDNAGVYICAPVSTAATSGIAVNAA